MWSLAVASLLAIAAPVAVAGSPAPQARVSADVLLWSINVPFPNFPKAYSPPLQAGGTYRIVATGTVVETNIPASATRTHDALWCFQQSPAGAGACSPTNAVRLPGRVVVHYEGDPSLHDLDGLNPGTQLPYNGTSHRYEETFTATRSSRLEAFYNGPFAAYDYQGAIGLELYQVSPPAGPQPGATGSPTAPVAGVTFLPPATKWGRDQEVVSELPPGGTAVLESPSVSPGQKKATIKVNGPVTEETIFAARLTAGHCLRAYLKGIATKNAFGVIMPGVIDEAEERSEEDKDFLKILAFMACLEIVREYDQKATAQSVGSSARAAARARCRTATTRIKVRFDRASRTASYRARRASRRQGRRLRVSCRATSDSLALTVRTRSRRTKLRSVVGPRLQVGLYRSSKSTGPGTLRTSFTR